MRPDQIRSKIDRMELSEKLLLVEDIWDSIAVSNSEIPMAKWQKQKLDKRYKEYKNRGPTFMTGNQYTRICTKDTNKATLHG